MGQGGWISSLWHAQTELSCLESGFCVPPSRQVRPQPAMLPGFVYPQRDLTPLTSQENPREVRKRCYLVRFVLSLAPSSTSSISVVSLWHSEKGDVGGNGLGARARGILHCFLVALISLGKYSSSLSSALEECQRAVCCHVLSAFLWCASRSLGLNG